ncbi:copper homeostasis protein CutC [Pendulispora rubella]|uniref:Copper homeostasis protein cutC homolog n=1 Tax=Pendulispora rubella TaxID=2741070 RepID=A0ABZ2LF18_9BACT
MPSRLLLEIIAIDAIDAHHAVLGGADRLELVSGMEVAGLSPSVDTFRAARDAVDVPIRVMIRLQGGFSAGGRAGLDALVASAEALRRAGADEFVLGWLDDRGHVDLDAVRTVVSHLDGCAWTFHKAIDHASNRDAVYDAIRDLPGLDTVLTSGGPDVALDVLTAEASRERARGGPEILVGGGLRVPHLAPLLAGGVTAFHFGSAARPDGSWSAPISADLVRALRDRL